jgi:Tfp pilus assembly protein PilF
MRRRENLPPDDLLLLANCAFNSGDYRTAFAAGETLIKRETVRVPGLYWQAKAGQKLAVRALTRASVLDPASPRMHLLIAEAYRERNSFREAEAEYRKAIQLAPNNVASHLGLAMVYWDSGENDKAAPEVQKALALKPGDPEASYIMGALLVDQDQYEEAKPYLNSALAGATAILPHVHALRGKVFAAQGRTWEAVEELKQSLSADLDGSYHFQLYQLYKKLGNEPAATAALQESESLRRHRPKPE